jgi:hypothetical protein
VIFDRQWLEASLRNLGLGIIHAVPPTVRGFQWLLHIGRLADGKSVVRLPEDRAPFGRLPPPIPANDPASIGR